jgi:hypothetical protein
MDKVSCRLIVPLLAVWVFALASYPAFAVVGDTVITDQGKPIPGAKVSIYLLDGQEPPPSTTDQNGKASLTLPEIPKEMISTLKILRPGMPVWEQSVALPGKEQAYKICTDAQGGTAILGKDAMARVAESATPLKVGANSDVGSGARSMQKATDMVTGALGGALGGFGRGGGMFGGGGSTMGAPSPGPSGGADQPMTVNDPFPAAGRRIFTDPATGTQIAVGGQMTPQGLLVTSTILNSPDDGTFQDIHLQSPDGLNAGPTEYYIYELYRDWTLKVWWTRDTYVNGQHVKHEQGGWSSSGRDVLGTFRVPAEGDGIWKRLGFSNAAKGIRSLGTLFPVSPELVQSKSFNLVVHVTRPGQDVVTTLPFVLNMPPGPWAQGTGAVPFLMVN